MREFDFVTNLSSAPPRKYLSDSPPAPLFEPRRGAFAKTAPDPFPKGVFPSTLRRARVRRFRDLVQPSRHKLMHLLHRTGDLQVLFAALGSHLR